MALLKRPAPLINKRQYHIRIDEQLADKAERYAEFIEAKTIDHVVSEALDYIFKKDTQFNEWLAKHPVPFTTLEAGAPKGKPNGGTIVANKSPEMAATTRATI